MTDVPRGGNTSVQLHTNFDSLRHICSNHHNHHIWIPCICPMVKLILLLAVIFAAQALATAQSSCKKDPPIVRDYTWRNYNGFNGYAYKKTEIKDSIFRTKKMPTLRSCFQDCVDTRTSPKYCLTFSYEYQTKKCRLSNLTIPYDPTDPQDLAAAQRWCPKNRFTSGWIIDKDD